MKNQDRKHQELAYQAERSLQIKNVQPTPKNVIERYRETKLWRFVPKEYVFKVLGNLNGKIICDLGCGEGVITSQLAKFGAQVTAVDISPDLIEIAERRAVLDEVRSHIKFIIGDVEKLRLPENKFDFLLAYEVLHHIDIPSILPKIIASLKPYGKAIIVEPIACSPVLQKLRIITPIKIDGGTHDRQLNIEDLKLILSYFGNYEITYFRLFGRLERLFPRGGYMNKIVMLSLSVIDRVILNNFPFLWKFCGIVVIVGTKFKTTDYIS